MKKKIKKKILSILLSTVLLVNLPLFGFTKVKAADAVTANNPLLMPLAPWLGLVAIGTGIIGKNAADSATQLIQNAANNLKEKELEKINNDSTYDSPFRVIQGGSDKKPQKPNNNNKNGAWFALGAASSLGSAMLFEKGAAETAMQTLQDLQAYQKYVSELGIESADKLLSTASASGIALQLANISNSAVKQFDDFLHSSWFTEKGLNPDDCLFSVGVSVRDILTSEPSYPDLIVNVMVKSNKLSKVKLSRNIFKYYTYTYGNDSLSYYYVQESSPACQLLDENNVAVQNRYYRLEVFSRSDISKPISTDSLETGNNSYYQTNTNSSATRAYAGYKWTVENPWGLTNNVYNYNQTFNVNFPDWQQGIMEILGKQLEGINIGGITSPISQPNWEPTQQQVQGGTVPQNVITQYINNYQNPESIPDDELNPDPDPNPDPNPDPDPDPNPDPEPEPEPVPESALDEAGQSLWDFAISKIVLPDDLWNKVPFCLPYDGYLLVKSMFPTGSGTRKMRMLKASYNSPTDPNGITISSNFDATGQNTRVYEQNNRWVNNAPIINLDLHFKYHSSNNEIKQLDIVKTVNLGEYGYFAMIIYIGIYVMWFGEIIGFIGKMF